MSAYRDSFDNCPRCGVELRDAGAGRACSGCRGQWITGAVLQEMANAMTTPLTSLPLMWIQDAHETLACPECGKAMETWQLYDVPIDRCPDQHGVWFDRDELQRVLLGSVRFVK